MPAASSSRRQSCSVFLLGTTAGRRPSTMQEDLFPPEKWHNHGSCVVEAPGGGLFAAWFHGSGERKSDDVLVQAARLPEGTRLDPRFTLADTPGYP